MSERLRTVQCIVCGHQTTNTYVGICDDCDEKHCQDIENIMDDIVVQAEDRLDEVDEDWEEQVRCVQCHENYTPNVHSHICDECEDKLDI